MQFQRSRFAVVIILSVIGILTTAVDSLAEPVVGEVFSMNQPDGSTIRVRIWGDEFFTHVETLDGYTVVRDPDTLKIVYAKADGKGDLVSTGFAVGSVDPGMLGLEKNVRMSQENIERIVREKREDFARRGLAALGGRAASGLRVSSTGNVVGITLLIDFSDDAGTISTSIIDDYCNLPGFDSFGINGSVYDYYFDVSDGALNYTNFVPATYYRAQQPKTHYVDPNVPFGVRARELIIEALQDLDDSGFDFSEYDSDSDGIIDAVNCFYAGNRDSAWGEGLWPHAWYVDFCADGVCTQRYQMTDLGDQLRLRTFVHENGHMLMGWPDLYDYDYDSTGVGNFCLMAYGANNLNPCEPNAYFKYDAGWASVTELIVPTLDLEVTAGVNAFYRYSNSALWNEFFIIENRQKTGRDASIPDRGVAIWHIDVLGDNDNNQMLPNLHYMVTLVQADGLWEMENNINYGDADDLYSAPHDTQFTPTSDPNTDWWSGDPSGLSIVNISTNQTTMNFDFSTMIDCNGNGVPDHEDIGGGGSDDCNQNQVPDECDLQFETSTDCDNDGVPDECQSDCNENGLGDVCELSVPYGLAGAYYPNVDFSGAPVGRIDPNINFDWGSGPPIGGIGSNQFGVRWTGYVTTPDADGTYTFFSRTDDGVRLWVNDELVIDKWFDQGPTTWIGTIDLAGLTTYRFKMEYYNNNGEAVAGLSWRPPGGFLMLIPATLLTPGRDCDSSGTLDSCDIVSGNLQDLDGNMIPDECEALLCPFDLDGNGAIGPGDVGVVKNNFGCDLNEPACAALDFDGNGAIGPGDVGQVKNDFGACP